MNRDTVIISMTSYPARIKYVGLVWYSILKSITPTMNVHCVLVLAKEEFPKLEQSLPTDLRVLVKCRKIELLWCDKNTKSHKKLMPTLTAYPNNPILVIDDDQLRTPDWLQNFLTDHQKYPNDVLAGLIHFRWENGKFKYSPVTNGERGTLIKKWSFSKWSRWYIVSCTHL